MAFDKTLPSNSTKIRNYPSVLTSNFAAIQTGDLTFKSEALNFIERDAVVPGIASDPTRDDDTMIIYSKQDAATNTELFVMDDTAGPNIMQLTEDGRIGSSSTDLSCSTLTFDGGTSSMSAIHQVTGWARVSAVGAITAGSGNLSVAQAGNTFTISFVVAPANANFVGIATFAENVTTSIYCNNYTATTFDVVTGLSQKAFQVVVFGGR